MKRVGNIISVALFSALVFVFLYQKGIIFANFEHLSPKEAYELIDDANVTFVDVREPEELIKEGKIKEAINLPLSTFPNAIKALHPHRDKKIIIFCRSGNRSIVASRELADEGFKVYNLKGGIRDWKSEGLPID
jgi:rhodanese-related sulfurtransferase